MSARRHFRGLRLGDIKPIVARGPDGRGFAEPYSQDSTARMPSRQQTRHRSGQQAALARARADETRFAASPPE